MFKPRGDAWFYFSREFLLVMNLKQAVILQHLLDVASKIAGDDGWFRCSVEDLDKAFHGLVDRMVQARELGRLKKAGFIEMKRAGMPASRHVRINVEQIETAIKKRR